jgi:hypothetical protein
MQPRKPSLTDILPQDTVKDVGLNIEVRTNKTSLATLLSSVDDPQARKLVDKLTAELEDEEEAMSLKSFQDEILLWRICLRHCPLTEEQLKYCDRAIGILAKMARLREAYLDKEVLEKAAKKVEVATKKTDLLIDVLKETLSRERVNLVLDRFAERLEEEVADGEEK